VRALVISDTHFEVRYLGYLTNARPGTAVLIDSDEPNARLLKIREHLSPLYRDRMNDNREGTRAGI
jgi:hypothetical protein